MQGIRPIDFDKDERAVYRQIADQIRELIRGGHFKPNEPIPSEVTMMEIYGCARGTVRQARELLEREEWIETRRGKGSFVKATPPSSR